MSAQSHTKKWLIFIILSLVWVVADLWTKHWADTELATPRHPLPVNITADEAGKPISEVLNNRFGFTEEELPEILLRMQRLQPAGEWTADTKLFTDDSPLRGVQSLWIYWREDRELAPRRFDLLDRRLMGEWLNISEPDRSQAEQADIMREALAELTFETWLPKVFRKISKEDVARLLAEKRIHAIPPSEGRIPASHLVKSGETYLVLDRSFDVMGDWWKWSYAENPGAAFGFMKGVDADLRYLLFTLLTIVALTVIIVVVYRLPSKHVWITGIFASIFGGAIGNFVDRIRYNYVIDFIDMDLGFMHWPTYNVADIGISVGVVLLLMDQFFNKNSPLVAKPQEKAES